MVAKLDLRMTLPRRGERGLRRANRGDGYTALF